MTFKEMDAVYANWLLDVNFREELASNPDDALAAYNLSPAEKQIISQLRLPKQHHSIQLPTFVVEELKCICQDF
ncbi:hypothetical protein ACFLYP_02415 [Chloroflexota bacterium]